MPKTSSHHRRPCIARRRPPAGNRAVSVGCAPDNRARLGVAQVCLSAAEGAGVISADPIVAGTTGVADRPGRGCAATAPSGPGSSRVTSRCRCWVDSVEICSCCTVTSSRRSPSRSRRISSGQQYDIIDDLLRACAPRANGRRQPRDRHCSSGGSGAEARDKGVTSTSTSPQRRAAGGLYSEVEWPALLGDYSGPSCWELRMAHRAGCR